MFAVVFSLVGLPILLVDCTVSNRMITFIIDQIRYWFGKFSSTVERVIEPLRLMTFFGETISFYHLRRGRREIKFVIEAILTSHIIRLYGTSHKIKPLPRPVLSQPSSHNIPLQYF